MFRKTCIAFCATVSLLGTTSCATLFQGTNEEISFASDPSGASVTVNDGRSGTTPYSIRENREEDLQVHFSKSGFQSQDVADTSHVQWGYVVSDIFFTGLIGLAVDGLDGAMFAHNQQMVSAHLDAQPSARAMVPQIEPASTSSGSVENEPSKYLDGD